MNYRFGVIADSVYRAFGGVKDLRPMDFFEPRDDGEPSETARQAMAEGDNPKQLTPQDMRAIRGAVKAFDGFEAELRRMGVVKKRA